MRKGLIGSAILATACLVTLASCGGNSISVIENSSASNTEESNTTTTETAESSNESTASTTTPNIIVIDTDPESSSTTTSTSADSGSSTSPVVTGDYVSIDSTFAMNDPIVSSYYLGSDKSMEQLYVETVQKCNDSVVDLTVSSGSGSGVLFAWDSTYNISYILTCYHMIDDVTSCKVKINGIDDKIDAKVVVGYDDQDLAIIAIPTPTSKALTYATLLDDSSSVYTGQTAIAIGNNDGYSHTVSDGIISYANRQWCTSLYNYKTVNQLQITTEINGGNSGGGLFSTTGALIGITNAGVETNSSGTASVEGVKFAVSYEEMWTVIDSFTKSAKYNTTSFDFEEGYVEGDFEIGASFSIGQYGTSMWSRTTVLYVSALATNETCSDYNKFQSSDIILGMTLNFADGRESITKSYETVSSTADFYTTLNNSGLKLGDTIEFNIQRYNQSTRSYSAATVSITLTQYTYHALF